MVNTEASVGEGLELQWVHYTRVVPKGSYLVPGSTRAKCDPNNPLKDQFGLGDRCTLHGVLGINGYAPPLPHLNNPYVVKRARWLDTLLPNDDPADVIDPRLAPQWTDRSDYPYAVVMPLNKDMQVYGGYGQDIIVVGPVMVTSETHIFYKSGFSVPDVDPNTAVLHEVMPHATLVDAILRVFHKPGRPLFVPIQDPEVFLNKGLPSPPNIKYVRTDSVPDIRTFRSPGILEKWVNKRLMLTQDEVFGKELRHMFPHFSSWQEHRSTPFWPVEECLLHIFGDIFDVANEGYNTSFSFSMEYKASAQDKFQQAEQRVRDLCAATLSKYPERLRLYTAAWSLHWIYWLCSYQDFFRAHSSQIVSGQGVKDWTHEMNHPKDPEQRQKDIARRVFGATL